MPSDFLNVPREGETWVPRAAWPANQLPCGFYLYEREGDGFFARSLDGSVRLPRRRTTEAAVRLAWEFRFGSDPVPAEFRDDYASRPADILHLGRYFGASSERAFAVEAVGATCVWVRIGARRTTVSLGDLRDGFVSSASARQGGEP